MKRIRFVLVLVVAVTAGIIFTVLTPAFAGGGHDEAGELEHVVSLEGKTGVNLLMAKWYNENRLLYAGVVTAVMAILGIVVGQITELALRLMGTK